MEDVHAKEQDLDESSIIPLTRRVSLPPDVSKGDPLYLVAPTPLHDRLRLENVTCSPENMFRAVLADLGAASTFASANDNQHKYSTRLRAPEVILHLPISPKTDVFNLACVIFHIVTLHDLFLIDEFGSEPDEVDDENLMAMTQRLGPLPVELRMHWASAERWTDREGQLRNARDPSFRPGTLQQDIEQLTKGTEMSADEVDAFTDFLASALKYDVEARTDTGTLFQHRWLTTQWSNSS